MISLCLLLLVCLENLPGDYLPPAGENSFSTDSHRPSPVGTYSHQPSPVGTYGYRPLPQGTANHLVAPMVTQKVGSEPQKEKGVDSGRIDSFRGNDITDGTKQTEKTILPEGQSTLTQPEVKRSRKQSRSLRQRKKEKS